MAVLRQVFFLVTTLISVPTSAKQVFYVSPDNSTNTSCLFQPCATLSQYLLDNNGLLPVVSNVEYHFLPGEHHVPTNMTLQYLHNFTISGCHDSTLTLTVIIGGLKSFIRILDSEDVTIKSVIFRNHSVDMIQDDDYLYNLAFTNCFSCKIIKVKFMEYGFHGKNLLGRSYL